MLIALFLSLCAFWSAFSSVSNSSTVKWLTTLSANPMSSQSIQFKGLYWHGKHMLTLPELVKLSQLAKSHHWEYETVANIVSNHHLLFDMWSNHICPLTLDPAPTRIFNKLSAAMTLYPNRIIVVYITRRESDSVNIFYKLHEIHCNVIATAVKL